MGRTHYIHRPALSRFYSPEKKRVWEVLESRPSMVVAYSLVRNLPFDKPGRFYKGNLHAHSTVSDGTLPPEEVARLYREAGYDFLAITDHFLGEYGFPVTDTRPYRREGFTTLLGAELHAPETALGEDWHLLAVGLPPDFPPTSAEEGGPELARRASEAGAFVGIAHPAWYGLTPADAESLEGAAHAVEVYNHSSVGCTANSGSTHPASPITYHSSVEEPGQRQSPQEALAFFLALIHPTS